MRKHYFTSEAVSAGHPDKICDQIADAILDEALHQDPESKIAIECTIKDELVLIYGEANTNATIDYEPIAKNIIKEIWYEEKYNVLLKISSQSNEINQAVNQKELGAGDQGIMFGFACNETSVYMPLSIYYAQRLAQKLHTEFKNQQQDILRPDGKTQVTVEYEGHIIKRIDSIVVSTQHTKDISQEEIRKLVIEKVIEPIIDPKYIDTETKFIINPSGSFILGGSFGDSGTTGRKIVVDTYGGHGRIGGGCLSSKDPSKVDRSAAYYCRYVAKNIVANELADKCEVQVSYAIGMPKPLSIFLEFFGTNHKDKDEIYQIVERNFDFSVGNIIKELDLKRPIYKKTAVYGHFGREDIVFPREKIIELR